MKKTTKLSGNQPGEPPEGKMNRTLKTKEASHGGEQNGLLPKPHEDVENREGYLGSRDPH